MILGSLFTSKAEDSEDDEDTEYFDAMEDAASFITVTTEPSEDGWAPGAHSRAGLPLTRGAGPRPQAPPHSPYEHAGGLDGLHEAPQELPFLKVLDGVNLWICYFAFRLWVCPKGIKRLTHQVPQDHPGGSLWPCKSPSDSRSLSEISAD